MAEKAIGLVTDDHEPEEKKRPSGPVTVVLRDPIKFGSQTITELTIRPAKAKDLRGLQTRTGYELDTALALASRLTGQPNPVIDELAGEDFAEVMAAVADFMPGSQTIGVKPSPS